MNVSEKELKKHESDYSDSAFWDKLKKFAKKAGVKIVYKALQLYYALKSPITPAWAKTVIIGALGYFIAPIDLIPDIMPAVGWTDDLAALGAALVTVKLYITPEVKSNAKDQLKSWFGSINESELD